MGLENEKVWAYIKHAFHPYLLSFTMIYMSSILQYTIAKRWWSTLRVIFTFVISSGFLLRLEQAP